MSHKWIVLVLLLSVYYDDVCANSSNEEDDSLLTRGILQLLNKTMTNLDQKVCSVEEKYAAVEATLNEYTQVLDNVRGCNAGFERKLEEMKQFISMRIHTFSKKVEGLENQIRILQTNQAAIREQVNATCSTTCDDDDDDGDGEATTTTAPAACDSGWIESPTKCYFVSTRKIEWQEAVDACLDMDANLVEVRTDQEAAFLLDNMPNRVPNNDIIYTGRKRNTAETWVFLSDNEPVDFTVRSWDTGEPDGGVQRCGCMRENDDFNMLDCYCTGYDLYYICEKLR